MRRPSLNCVTLDDKEDACVLMLTKPSTKADLLPPFEYIGASGWDTALRRVLVEYEVPLASAVTEADIERCESELGFHLPQSLRLFLMTFGAINFDSLELLPPTKIQTLEQVWFREFLNEDEQAMLPNLIGVAEAGSDDYFALDVRTNTCLHCSHDPAGLIQYLPTFDDLIKVAVIDLSWGYFGWPDEEVYEMARALKKDLYGVGFVEY
jgi:hypothetical protein